MMINEFYIYKFIIIIMVNKVNKLVKGLKTDTLRSLSECE